MALITDIDRLRIHIQDWQDCIRCPLGKVAQNHVLYETVPKGLINVDVLIIGEGPGSGEDVIGQPFIGPAGKLLRSSLQRAMERGNPFTYCLTNLLACRPFKDRPNGGGNRAPEPEEVEACAPRLAELMNIMQPKLIMVCGQVPLNYVPSIAGQSGMNTSYTITKVKHPAWVLRQDAEIQRDYDVQVYNALHEVRISNRR